jgi:hypothetical protein
MGRPIRTGPVHTSCHCSERHPLHHPDLAATLGTDIQGVYFGIRQCVPVPDQPPDPAPVKIILGVNHAPEPTIAVNDQVIGALVRTLLTAGWAGGDQLAAVELHSLQIFHYQAHV